VVAPSKTQLLADRVLCLLLGNKGGERGFKVEVSAPVVPEECRSLVNSGRAASDDYISRRWRYFFPGRRSLESVNGREQEPH